jgi:SAM-dependent methyltransferase
VNGHLAFDSEARSLARLYDLDFLDEPDDVDLYLALARRTGGPVLELGVGSGRIAVALAQAGYMVTGVDHDPAMLDRARDRAVAAGLTVGRDVDLVHADMIGLDLPGGESYRLGLIALNTLMLLGSREAQLEAMRALARHLAPDGLAGVDVWLPDADDLARFDGRLILDYARTEPETGRTVTKIGSAQHDSARQVVTLTTIYEESGAGQPVERRLRTDTLRLVTADELRVLAEGAGLEVESIAGDYDLSPLGPGSERAVLVAVRPGPSR